MHEATDYLQMVDDAEPFIKLIRASELSSISAVQVSHVLSKYDEMTGRSLADTTLGSRIQFVEYAQRLIQRQIDEHRDEINPRLGLCGRFRPRVPLRIGCEAHG